MFKHLSISGLDVLIPGSQPMRSWGLSLVRFLFIGILPILHHPQTSMFLPLCNMQFNILEWKISSLQDTTIVVESRLLILRMIMDLCNLGLVISENWEVSTETTLLDQNNQELMIWSNSMSLSKLSMLVNSQLSRKLGKTRKNWLSMVLCMTFEMVSSKIWEWLFQPLTTSQRNSRLLNEIYLNILHGFYSFSYFKERIYHLFVKL